MLTETSFPPNRPVTSGVTPFQGAVTPGVSPFSPLSGGTVTPAVTPGAVTAVTAFQGVSGVKLCACGCGKPVRKPEHTHATAACRVRFHREKKKNDSAPTTEAPLENRFRKSIRQAAAAVAEKFKQPFRSDAADTGDAPDTPADTAQNPFALPVSASPDPGVGVLFRKAACAGVKATFGAANAVTRYFARRAELGDAFTDKLVKSLAPDPDALADFVESLDAVLKKHNWQPKSAEEWALAINFVRLMTPYGTAIAELRAEIRRKAKE